ncbi:TPA: sulfur carrier protein ThiS [Neisseria meningitidis]|uniref:sulfur carrier protein ThiS n=1 Tax=Neisseria meningitidis TaxID=487 RepID=UPI0002E0D0CE|nr:sulfur carrier protein ThiS [Neisseria meningitidis]MBJ7765818.1 sulfur carrier protein ThiS [Neisseria meningitidis]
MNIILNGGPAELHGTSVADLIAQTAPQKPFAVAVNTVFVPKGAYAETVLNENDKIDIVQPVVGG